MIYLDLRKYTKFKLYKHFKAAAYIQYMNVHM